MMSAELANRHQWSANKDTSAWLVGMRLGFLARQVRSLTGTETEVIEQLRRYAKFAGAAAAKLPLLLAT